MEIIISNSEGIPIYEQIYRRIKHAVISGEIRADDALPSIRALAKDLRISVITTKRAYEELERDGIIYSVVGKGFYVAHTNPQAMAKQAEKEIEELTKQLLNKAKEYGLCKEDIIKMININIE